MTDSDEDTLYLYRIPVEVDNGVRKPVYQLNPEAGLYLHHTTHDELVAILDKAAGHLHRQEVNAVVEELDKEEVVESEDRINKYV